MVKIRLKRMGRKHRPFYRVVAINSHARRQGACLEELGYYDPISKELKLNKVRVLELVAVGAQLSERAQWLSDKAPETGDLVKLDPSKVQKLSKKAQEKAKKAV
jgi:small subunit ribosomal protein S16